MPNFMAESPLKALLENILLYIFAHSKIVPWCNGSTADFGSACPGSNPSGTALKAL